MLAYHRGTWRDGDELPDIAAPDVYMRRYHWSWQEYCDTPLDVLEELAKLIEAEIEFKLEEKEKEIREQNRERAKQNLKPLPMPRRRSRTKVLELPVAHEGKTAQQIVDEFMSD